MTGVAFELGINYWPSRRAMYMWQQLDLVEVRDEMMHIADMGFDTVGSASRPGAAAVHMRARLLATDRVAPSTLPTRSTMRSGRVVVPMRAHGWHAWPRRCGVARRMYP